MLLASGNDMVGQFVDSWVTLQELADDLLGLCRGNIQVLGKPMGTCGNNNYIDAMMITS